VVRLEPAERLVIRLLVVRLEPAERLGILPSQDQAEHLVTQVPVEPQAIQHTQETAEHLVILGSAA